MDPFHPPSSHDERDEHYLGEVHGSGRWPLSEDIFERSVSDLKRRPWLALDAREPLQAALRQMVEQRIGSVMVTEGERLVGIFTERDLLKRMAKGSFDPQRETLGTAMTREVAVLHGDDTVALAIHRMSQGGHRHLPIVDGQSRPAGLVSVRDIVDYLAEMFPHKILTVSPDPRKVPKSQEGG
jgi:CBS domain-containing protein